MCKVASPDAVLIRINSNAFISAIPLKAPDAFCQKIEPVVEVGSVPSIRYLTVAFSAVITQAFAPAGTVKDTTAVETVNAW